MSNLGENDRSRYTFIPPERGIPDPNSSITIAPQVDMAPAITHVIRAMPGLPASLKIVDGVAKILPSIII